MERGLFGKGRSRNTGIRQSPVPAAHNAVGDIRDHAGQQAGEMAAGRIVRRGDEVHAVGIGGQVIAFAETAPGFILRIIYGYGVASVPAHDGEAGNVRRAVADVNHIGERNGAHVFRHVVVYVLVVIQHSLVDAEKVLGFCGMGDDSLGKIDVAVLLAEFASEYGLEIRAQGGTVNQGFQTGGDDIVFNADAQIRMKGGEGHGRERVKKVRQAGVKGEAFSKLGEPGVADAVQGKGVQQAFHVNQFSVPAFSFSGGVAPGPEFLRRNAEFRENGLILHVEGTQGLVVVEDQGDRILRGRHGKDGK